MSYVDILGKLKSIVYINTDLVIVNFTGKFNGCSPFKSKTPINICMKFESGYNKKIKLSKDIFGFAHYDYEYTYNEIENKLEQSSNEKTLDIEIYEDLEKFDLFSKILKDNSVISVSVDDGMYRKDNIEFIEREYKKLTEIDNVEEKDISKLFLEITSYMNTSEELDKLKEKCYPIKMYRVFTEYNSYDK